MMCLYLVPSLLMLGCLSPSVEAKPAQDCTAPDLTNGQVWSTGDAKNMVATFTCNDGFTLEGKVNFACTAGRWAGDFPICKACEDNKVGFNCELCAHGFYEDAYNGGSCEPCNCYPKGTYTLHLNETYSAVRCDIQTGQCVCKPYVAGRNCDRCEDFYFNIDSELGCEPCNCDSFWSLDYKCHINSGQCHCRPGVTGRRCDQCKPNHYDFSREGPLEGCKPCNCDPIGSIDQQCDVFTGQCPCKKYMEGRMCDQRQGSGDDVMNDMLHKMRFAFLQIDTDGDGKIRCDQLRELLLAADPILTDDYVDGVEMIATMADADDDDMLTVDELINFFTATKGEEPTRTQQGAAMFILHDTDHNGKMSLEELNAMYLAGRTSFVEGNTGLMDWLLQVMDTNKDGKVSLEEYIQYVSWGI